MGSQVGSGQQRGVSAACHEVLAARFLGPLDYILMPNQLTTSRLIISFIKSDGSRVLHLAES